MFAFSVSEKLLKCRKCIAHSNYKLREKINIEDIAKDDYYFLRKEGLVEGRYPNIYVSYKVANMVGTPAEYVKNKGLDKDVNEQLVISALKIMKSARVSDIKAVLEGALPAIMDGKQQDQKNFKHSSDYKKRRTSDR